MWIVHPSLANCQTAAQEQPATADKLELIPEDQSLWKESLLWDKDLVLRTGIGYKDNVLLAPSGGRGSGFFMSGLDLSVIRLPLDGWQFNFTLVGDDVRYFRRPGGLSSEDLVGTSAQLEKYFGVSWRAGLELRYSYVDQVLQELLSAGGVQAIEAKGNLFGMRPFVRRDLSTNWWVQLESPFGREWWQAPLDATWKLGGQAVGGYDYGKHSGVSVSAGAHYIPHDEWLALDAQGNALNHRLALWREIAELKWEHHWDTRDRWSTVTRLGYNHSRDNGGGYFDYDRYYGSLQLRYHTQDWEAKATGGVSYFQFPVQNVGGPGTPALHLTTVTLSLRLDRRVYRNLRCFGGYEYEKTASDDSASEYHYHVGTCGVSWEF